MECIRYKLTSTELETPVVWAYTHLSVLEGNLTLYYQGTPLSLNQEVDREVAERTQHWNNEYFQKWCERDRGTKTAFNLGKIVENTESEQESF